MDWRLPWRCHSCTVKSTLKCQTTMIWQDYSMLGEEYGFSGIVFVLTACIENEKIAQLLRSGNMQVEVVKQQSSWKPLHLMAYGYGTHSSSEHNVCAIILI